MTDLSQSAETDGPSFKYVLEPSAFYSGDAVEREEERTGKDLVVGDISSIEAEAVREAIETAIRTGHWRSNTLPDGLAATVERVDFFTGVSDDETHTHVGLTLYRFQPDQPPAIEFDATIRRRRRLVGESRGDRTRIVVDSLQQDVDVLGVALPVLFSGAGSPQRIAERLLASPDSR